MPREVAPTREVSLRGVADPSAGLVNADRRFDSAWAGQVLHRRGELLKQSEVLELGVGMRDLHALVPKEDDFREGQLHAECCCFSTEDAENQLAVEENGARGKVDDGPFSADDLDVLQVARVGAVDVARERSGDADGRIHGVVGWICSAHAFVELSVGVHVVVASGFCVARRDGVGVHENAGDPLEDTAELLRGHDRVELVPAFAGAHAAEEAHGRDAITRLDVARAGLRAGEIRALAWTDVNFPSRVLTVRRTDYRGNLGSPKSGRLRTIPMTDELTAALKAHRHLNGEVVFCDANGQRLSRGALDWILKKICRRASIRWIKWHGLRHTFCSHLAMRGAPARAIQELAGHASLMTTQRYMHLTPGAGRAAIDLLGQPMDNNATAAGKG